jgi:hypothetical protein
MRVLLVVFAMLSLIGGGSMYILFRNSDLIVFEWIDKPRFLHELYSGASFIEQPILSVLMYSVPDGLWLLAGILLIRALWLRDRKWCGIYVRFFCAIAVLSEILQLVEIIPGTFDIFDVMFLVGTAWGEGMLYNYFMKRRLW